MESQHVGTHQGEEEDHQEKSILTKVKEKAKKIKNKLTKRGHGPDHHDPDEEHDEKEEDLEEHGATTIGSRATGQGDIPKVPMAKFGDTKAAAMHDHDPKVPHLEETDPMNIKNKLTKRGHGPDQHDHHDPDEEHDEKEEHLEVHGATTIGSRATGQGDIPKVPMAKFGDTKAAAMHDHDPKVLHLEKTDPMKDCVPAASQRTRQIHSLQPGVTPMHDEVLEPRPNYHDSTMESLVGHDQIPSQQPKVDFGKTSLMGEAPHAPQNPPLPSLGEYKSQGTDRSQTLLSENEGHSGQSREQTPVSSLGGDDQKTNVADPRQTSVTGKEGHSGQTKVHLHHRGSDDRTPISSRGDYQKTNVTDPSHTSATGNEGHFGQSEVNLDRPRGLEEDPNAHMADPQAFTPSNDQTKVTDPPNAGGDEVGVTPILRSFDKMSIHAGDTKPSNQGSSYTEKVRSTASAIADKATSAKNAVASTLGYGGGNNDQHEDVNPRADSPENGSTKSGTGQNLSTPENPSNQGSYTGKISSATNDIADTAISAQNVVPSKLGYGGDTGQQQHGDHAAVGSGSAEPEQQGEGITAAVTEKPTPVHEKVAGAGSTLMSKLPGSTGTAGKEEVHQGTATTRGEYDKAGKDQGVSEKLKPGEEDGALSEVISETLHERKAEQPRSGARPDGKVTESVEVTRQLGPDYGAEDVQQSSYGKVLADTLKGAVGSLFGKADQTAASPESLGSSTGTEGLSSSGTGVAERRGRGDESGK